MTDCRALSSVIKTVSFTVVSSLLLFVSAGRLDWAMGWAYAGLSIAGVAASCLVIGPDLLAERSGVGEGATAGDVLLALVMARLGPAAIAVTAGLNLRLAPSTMLGSAATAAGGVASGQLHWTQWLGIALLLVSYVFVLWAMATNRFFSGVMRIQRERGHSVVTSGPYAIVRHPGYAGSVLSCLGAPMMLGSPWAEVPAALTVVAIVVRTALEDRTLRAQLPGYVAYARKVRYRLIPGVW